jgi:hypothetical protein
MGNSFGTYAGTIVVQEVLATLLAKFPILGQISTDFKNKTALFNQTVMSRVILATTAQDFDPAVGYTATDRSSIDVPVQMAKHIHHTFKIGTQERSSTNRNLMDELIATGAHAVGKALVDFVVGKVTIANYANQYPVSANNWDRDDIVKIRTKLNIRNVADIPGQRFMLLNSEFAGQTGLDLSIVGGINNPGVTTLQDGKLPMVHGFNLSEYSGLATNGENLAGFAGTKDAIVLATRLPDEDITSDVPIPGKLEIVIDPNTGIAVLHRHWYDMKFAEENHSITLMLGASPGLTGPGVCDRIERIVTP